ncbi:hypothetical protein GCM10027084_07530 [Pseudoxanthomonas sangjuensis]|uniref:hypothetical protein n=1 Tax=Pseudoxanthomonas sangjuensis TaxID=1503750 RepID=UPI001390B32B|nr:hypothetical protein [Pseudoxanthomonas sangjuensis]
MAQHHSDTAAAVAFQSDIARALSRRAADMPLHSQVQANKGGSASVPPKKKKAKGKVK